MKLSSVLVLAVCAGVVAFVAGHRTHQERGPATAPAEARRTAAPANSGGAHASRDAAAVAAVRAIGKYAACSQEFSASNAARLSSQERLQLLANGALVGDYGNQEAMLCGLISVLSREEIQEATGILSGIQDQGNRQAPEVWKSLWQQWGRLDPEGGLAHFGADEGGKSPVDARNMMTGWLETDAAGALAWAQKPGKAPLEAAAAALAISQSANGDLKQLESAILKFPGEDATAKACLDDYFDLASLAGKDQSAAAIYEQISPSLRPAAWPAAAKRIGYGNSAEAKAWLTEHAGDPGRNYGQIGDLFQTLTYEDPAGTARWAVQLPYSAATDPVHPAVMPVANWLERDPEAAAAWLKTQPADVPWNLRQAR
ncbi:MAG: hypothetical protein JWO82_2321 [Akkermansiaceae bacterium]|nr:hypothetical protein [Akkermansiaceae bacterium]